MKFPGIVVGNILEKERIVDAIDIGGELDYDGINQLLSTPRLIALMTEFSIELIESRLPDGFISVGKRSDVVHEHPVVQSTPIRVTIELTGFDGYHIQFRMTVHDEKGIVARGHHERSIVNKRWMQLKVSKRIAEITR